jgi:hypothetical protein
MASFETGMYNERDERRKDLGIAEIPGIQAQPQLKVQQSRDD